jgi:nicotinamidase-related amidase
MNKALLIIDIQNDYFVNGRMPLTNPDKAAANAKLLLEEFRAKGLPVIHIQHVSIRPTATFFLPNTQGVQIHESVKPMGGEKIIIKHYPNSFRETDLLDFLRSRSITDLVICGMMTHMCVDATTRAAKDYDFNIVLVGDACATKDLEINGARVNSIDVQNSFLAALNYFYATVDNTQHYLNRR